MMKKIKTIFLVIASLILNSCAPNASTTAYQAIGSYSNKVEKEWNWSLFSYGGQFGNDIKKFDVGYKVFQEVDIMQARQIIVKGVQEFLKTINNQKQIQPFLTKNPFTYYNLQFNLIFKTEDDGDVQGNHIANILLMDGKLWYSINYPYWYENVHSETYEEALKLVQNDLFNLTKKDS